ncbi:MAG: KpsF/GutQ family sugar-phosphate isomerase [Planctomycetales bacterium]|nr:KpsF/GutQ family sugar-phosphate isomerase [Planctomycetales bacterium]
MTATRQLTRFQQLDLACRVLNDEAAAIQRMSEQLNSDFCDAADAMLNCRGAVIVTGMGKAGLIGRKITATLASTGTRSHFLHPAEALHGDLGEIANEDVVVILSHSGETEEILRLLPSLQSNLMIAITASKNNTLATTADITLSIGTINEAGNLQLAPSTSTTTMLALGDALALVVSECRGFQATDFAKLHPAGSLGRKLAIVDDIMRPLSQCRVANQLETVRQVLISRSTTGRRTGAILLTDDAQHLVGIFTDSDLSRLFESQRDDALDRPIKDVMSTSPQMARSGESMSSAVERLVNRKISELPVVDSNHSPVGMIDITDVVAFLPNDCAKQDGDSTHIMVGDSQKTNFKAQSA